MADKVFKFMADDHDRLDNLYKSFQKNRGKDWAEATEIFHQFKTGLQRHIIWEEDILFSLFENKTGATTGGPTEMMRDEHKQIKAILEKIHEGVIKERVNKKLDNDLFDVLEPHNRKEEEILYPWIDQIASEKETVEMFKKMDEIKPERYNYCC